MPHYLLIYKAEPSQVPRTPEDAEAAMTAWGDWMHKAGPHIIDPGNPVGRSWTVDADGAREGGGQPPTMGYTILDCPTLEAALALAADNPMVFDGGEVEVSPIVPIEM